MSQHEEEVDIIVNKYFDVTNREWLPGNAIRYSVVGVKGDYTSSFKKLYSELVARGYAPALKKDNDVIYLILGKISTKVNWATWSTLAALTILMVYLSGTALGAGWQAPVLFLLGLLGPLLIHESGHWIIMRFYSVPRSPPYLIPAPPLQLGFLGTLGAVINMKWVPATADELAIVGIMGPLFGFIAAIPVAVIGIHMSQLVPVSATVSAPTLTFAPLAFEVIAAALSIPSGYYIRLSPLAFASYVVLFVTFLNLIPIGQLDGGHVVRAAVGERWHLLISVVFTVLLLVLGTISATFVLFGIIALILLAITGGRHPGPAIQESSMSWKGYLAVVVYGLLLALTMPIPV